MKTRLPWAAFGLAVGISLLYWLLDGIVGYFAYRDYIRDILFQEPIDLWDNLFLNIPSYHFTNRVSVVVACLLGGGIAAYLVHRREQALQAQAESERIQKFLLDSISVGYGVEDLTGRTIVANHGFAKVLGYTAEEMLNMHFTEYTHPDFADEDARLFREMAAGTRDRYQLEKRYISRTGEEIWGRLTRTLARDKNGRPERCFGVLENITEHKKAQNDLRAREAQISALVDHSPIGVFFKDTERRYLFVNNTYCDFHGLRPEALIGKHAEAFQDPESARSTLNEDLTVIETRRPLHTEKTLVHEGGNARHFSLSKFPVTDSNGAFLGLGGLLIEVTELKNAERRAIDLSERMNRILNGVGEGICELDMDGTVIFINSAGASILGWDVSDLIGRRFHETVHSKRPDGYTYHSDDCPACHALRSKVESQGANEIFWRKDGESVAVDFRATPILVGREPSGLVLVFEDISQRVAMEGQLRHAQKMEAVGQLTGGIAHDFNNLLQVVQTNLELLRFNAEDASSVADTIDRSILAVEKGAKLTHQLLAFSRKQTLRPTRIDIRKLIDGMLKILARTLGEDIQIETHFSIHDFSVLADENGLENALLNLAINARAAMPKGGSLTLTSRYRHIDSDIPIENGTLTRGDYVEISVSDTGRGMSADVLNRAFEPFFTTKDVGKGSGLGLSMVYGFARQSGGNVTIESAPGRGTTARMLLPASAEEAEAKGGSDAPEYVQEHAIKVLLVEDETDVRYSTALLLRSFGCDVLEAEGASTVLATLDQDDSIDLLLSDVVLPGGMNGIELARDAIRRRPELNVVLVSGYPDAALEKAGMTEVDFPLLRKPFSKSALSHALEQAKRGVSQH